MLARRSYPGWTISKARHPTFTALVRGGKKNRYYREMERRTFLQAAAAAPLAFATDRHEDLPKYRVVTRFQPSAQPGMPGQYPGIVARVQAQRSIDENSEKVDAPTVREMISQGLRALTGDSDARD